MRVLRCVISIWVGSISSLGWCDASDHATALASLATQWIAQDQNKPQEEISVRPPDRRAMIVPCEQSIEFKWPFTANNLTLEASCAAPKWRYFLQVKYIAGSRVWAANRDLAAGHEITHQDLLAVTIEGHSSKFFSDISDLIGQTLKKDIGRTEPIQQSDIRYLSNQFQTTRFYRAGEEIKLEDLTVLSEHDAAKNTLLVWPLGMSVTQRAISAGHTLTPSDITPAVEVIVADKNILRHQVITPDMIKIAVLPQDDIRQSSLTRLDAAIGLEATRTIQVGSTISRSDLRPADLVRKGENVTLTIRRGVLTLTVDTIALEDAKLGDQVLLLNADSGTEIRGIVTGRYQAKGK